MGAETHRTDADARLVLPMSFANATVIIEQVSEGEIRVRRVESVPDPEIQILEEVPQPLSDRSRDHFLQVLAQSFAPSTALTVAAERHMSRRG